jgi:hypothetical protein
VVSEQYVSGQFTDRPVQMIDHPEEQEPGNLFHDVSVSVIDYRCWWLLSQRLADDPFIRTGNRNMPL